MVTFRGRHGYDGKAALIDGFEVILDEQVVGFIWPGGHFSRSCPEGFVEGSKVLMSQENLDTINQKCAQVRKMPSEYGWIGVGEPMDPSKPKLVIDCGRVYEEVVPGVQLHRRDLEDSHDNEI